MLGIVPVLVLQAASAAAAPAPEPQKEQSQDIIVTGERVQRRLRDTPSSVAVFTAREIDAAPVDRMEQLIASVPNVVVVSSSQGPSIRGQDSTGVLNSLPAFLGGARPPATVEVDGRAVGFQEFIFGNAPLWDVKQVEVFRSPLTVTHGRNSIGGGIVITTNDPTYDWEGAGRVIAGDFDTKEASAAVSGPIVADQLAFRLAGDIRHQHATAKLAPVMRGANPNKDDYSLLRFKLLGEPAALPGFKIVGTFAHTRSQAPQDVPLLQPIRKRTFPFGGYGIFRVKVDAATVHATQQFGNGQVDAVASLGDTNTRRFASPGEGEARAHLVDKSIEMFGSWKPGDAVILRGGVHVLDSNFSQRIDITANFVGSIGDFKDRQDSFGIFGEAEFALTGRLTMSAGGRYQHDRQKRDGTLVGRTNAPIDFDARFSAFLPKFTATYALNPRLKAGLLVQRAYNPGGATLDFDTGGLDRFGAEHLWDYEAFLKGDVGANISLEANLFYNAIRDAQRVVALPITLPNGSIEFTSKFNNVPEASTAGAEAGLAWHPSPALALRGGIGLLRTRIKAGQNSDGEVIGREFQRAPHLTGSAAADWIPLKGLRLSGQLRYHGRYFSDDFDTPELLVGRAAIVDARAAYTLRRFTIFAYVRNVFDSFHITSWAQRNPDIAEAEDPRMAGIGIEARF
jgi:outer membrane receptor protein involved in Fe transport